MGANSVLDQKGPGANLPERHSPGEPGDKILFGAAEAEQPSARLGLVGRLAEHHPRLGVGQEPRGQLLFG